MKFSTFVFPFSLLLALALILEARHDAVARFRSFSFAAHAPTAAGDNVLETRALYYLQDNQSGWRGNPHTLVYRRQDGQELKHYANSDGFLDREHPLKSDFYRIGMVGNSWVEAQQVPSSSRFVDLSEQLIFDASQGRRPVEIFNFGLSNLGTAQQYGLVREKALRYRPHELWVFFAPRIDIASNFPLATSFPLGPTYTRDPSGRIQDVTFGYPRPPAVMTRERHETWGHWLKEITDFSHQNLSVLLFVHGAASPF